MKSLNEFYKFISESGNKLSKKEQIAQDVVREIERITNIKLEVTKGLQTKAGNTWLTVAVGKDYNQGSEYTRLVQFAQQYPHIIKRVEHVGVNFTALFLP